MDDARAFLPLSPQQFQILLALIDGDRHGYGIILDVEARTGGRLGTGTLYTAVAGLEDDRLIEEAPARVQTHARRTLYRITALGRAVLRAETTRLEALVRDARRKGVRPAAPPALSASRRSQ